MNGDKPEKNILVHPCLSPVHLLLYKRRPSLGRLFIYIVSSVPRRLAEFSTHLNMKYPSEP